MTAEGIIQKFSFAWTASQRKVFELFLKYKQKLMN